MSRFMQCFVVLILPIAGWCQMQPGGMQPPGPPMGVPQSTVPPTGSTTQGPQVDPYGTDKDFVKKAAEAGAVEVHLGKIAQERGSSDAVKTLGKQMAEASTQTGQQLRQAAKDLKIHLPAEPPRRAKKDEAKLAKLSGADFDRAYAQMAVDEQKEAVKQFEKEAKGGNISELKDYAAKNLPVEQERQKKAEELASAAPGLASTAK